MNAEKLEKIPPPPGIIGSLRAGFDVVSSRIWLILLPLFFDSFLWLGAQMSAGKLYSALVNAMIETLKTRPLPLEEVKTLTDSVEVFSRFNWLSWLRTFPVGIPSLEAFALPAESALETPFGLREVIYLESIWGLMGWTIFLILAGWVGGSLYFRWVSMAALGEADAKIGIARALFQTAVISILCMICLTIIAIPIMLIVGLAGFISPTLANGALFLIFFLSYWLVVPFFFMPHGIFARKQNALLSFYSSLRLTQLTLPTSGLFVFTSFLLTKGLNFLWSVPESDTWMRLVGIAGHAFISTTILAASFVYYRDMGAWLQTVFAQSQQKQGVPTQQA